MGKTTSTSTVKKTSSSPSKVLKADQKDVEFSVTEDISFEVEEINLEKRYRVKNISDHQVSWRKLTTIGDETLVGGATVPISGVEIEAQVSSGNKFFVGYDGLGSGAKVYILDEKLRKYFEFDSADGKTKQKVLTDEKISQILSEKNIEKFEASIKEWVVGLSEASKLVRVIKTSGFNDYKKIKIIENYTNIRI